MKKIILTLSIALASVMLLSSCGSQKKLTDGRTKIKEPLSSAEYLTDADYFRKTSSGTSPDQEMAKTIAMMNATSGLASQIETRIQSVIKKFNEQYKIGTEIDFNEKIQSMTIQTIDQILKGAEIKGSELYKLPGGNYEYWINLEISKDTIKDAFSDAIIKNKKLSVDFDEHLFDKIFNEEIVKIAKGKNE